LSEIIDQSIKLGHLCAAQRSRLRFGLLNVDSEQGSPFLPDRMTNVFGPDPTDLSGKPVKFAIFPVLLKYEDKKVSLKGFSDYGCTSY